MSAQREMKTVKDMSLGVVCVDVGLHADYAMRLRTRPREVKPAADSASRRPMGQIEYPSRLAEQPFPAPWM